MLLGEPLPFDDNRCKIIRTHLKIRCWFEVAPQVYLTLAIGWCFVIISIIAPFQVPSSGAVLVCASVLAEVSFERLTYRQWPRTGLNTLSKFILIQDSEARLGLSGDAIHIAGNKDGFGGAVRALLGLSKDLEWSSSGDVQGQNYTGAFWSYTVTIARVEKVLTRLIVVSVIIGTFVWGYGHCLYQSCRGPI